MAHITIADVDPVTSYTATASQTQFDISWPFFTDASIKVYQTPSGQDADDATDLLTLTTDYTVTGAGNVAGVTRRITLVTGAGAGDTIVIQRDEPIARSSDLAEQGNFSSETYNDEQDKELMILQQLRSDLGRGLSSPVTGGDFDAGSKKIIDVSDPVSDQDAATKAHVSSVVASAQLETAGLEDRINIAGPALNFVNGGSTVGATRPASSGGLLVANSVTGDGSLERVLTLADNVVVTEGSFTPTFTGITTTPSTLWSYTKISFTDQSGNENGLVSIYTNESGVYTSNATTFTVTNVPSAIQPSGERHVPCRLFDDIYYAMGIAEIDGATITFGVQAISGSTLVLDNTGFASSGSKGLPEVTLTYPI